MSPIAIIAKKRFSRREKIVLDAKRELRKFLPRVEVERVRTLEGLKSFIDKVSKKAEGLDDRKRATLCYHRLAVNSAIKRGY